ncbi:MAG: hypothetical protein ACXABY_07490 [Candidatus Thorarchaeota archaeon]|jgi:hypothetical protein
MNIDEFLKLMYRILEKVIFATVIIVLILLGTKTLLLDIVQSLFARDGISTSVWLCMTWAAAMTFVALGCVVWIIPIEDLTPAKIAIVREYDREEAAQELENRKPHVLQILREHLIKPPHIYEAPHTDRESIFRINMKEAACDPGKRLIMAHYLVLFLIAQLRRGSSPVRLYEQHVKFATHTEGNPILVAEMCRFFGKVLHLCNSSSVAQSAFQRTFEISPREPKLTRDDTLIFIHDVNMGMESSVKACNAFQEAGAKKLHYVVLFNRVPLHEVERKLKKRLKKYSFHSCFDFTDQQLQDLLDGTHDI